MAGRHSKLQPLVDLAVGLTKYDEEERDNADLILTPAREDALESWKLDPWAFLTGKDPDTGEPIIKTVDQRDKKHPVKGYPAHLDYLHYLVDLLQSEEHLIGEKSSQMIFSTTVLLYDAWCCAFKPGYKVLLSKHSEEEAEILLAEKVRTPWGLMPQWLQRQIPLSKKPKNTVIFPKEDDVESLMLGLPENAAAAKARGQTYQAGRIDEAEFQDMLSELITAMLPRCGQLVLWSTPSEGGDGVNIFRSFLGDDPIKIRPNLVDLKRKYAHVKGMSTRRNESKDFTVVRVHYSADPSKTKEWADKGRISHVSRAKWDREMEISRTSNAGKLFYPQFVERPNKYMRMCVQWPKNTPFLRGWDFGGANPACVWGVWSMKSKRFWVLRELLGQGIDTYQFRDLVKYLSGQLSIEGLTPHNDALRMLEDLKATKGYPPAPWFEGQHRFLDFAGHEGKMGGRGLQRKGEAKTAEEILALGGLNLYSTFTLHSSRTEVINGLSRLRDDGWPGLLIDPACVLLWEGLANGIVYAKPTAQHPDPTEPAIDSTYSHLHDALGYAVTSVVRLEDADYLQSSLGEDGRIIYPEGQDLQVLSYLTYGV